MKNLIIIPLLFVLSVSGSISAQDSKIFKSSITASELRNAPAPLIPFPDNIIWDNAFIPITEINISGVPERLKNEIIDIVTFHGLGISENGGTQIEFITIDSLSKESYHLTIANDKIKVESSDDSGQYYALQTLRQLIQIRKGSILLPQCTIKDKPAYSVRGFMLDVGRNFQSKQTLKKLLDVLSRYKLNTFHWHLTDRPAWRIESKKYPELTAPENHRSTRDPGQYYTYDDIREIIDYARKKHIMVIPEIDMPGHSDSFVKSMGVKMESEKGMEILEHVLNEFFEEIPVSDCPIIHIGSDEVRIDNPDEFISKMVNICKSHNRKVMIWNPGLTAENDVIRQTWQTKHVEKGLFQEIDSWNNYINNGEPMTQIQRLFFKPIGYPSENEIIGGILCLWHDVNLDNETDFLSQNPVYPSMLTYAWKTWTAGITQAPEEYYMTLPANGSKALEYFAEFENILLSHKDRYFKNEPFPYFRQHDKFWTIFGMLKSDTDDDLNDKILENYKNHDSLLLRKEAIGNTLVVKDRFKLGGYFPTARKGETAYAFTYIHSNKNRKIKTLIGFETPMRANRTYSGIPPKGDWDVNGGWVKVNNQLLDPPQWEKAGWKPSKKHGWGSAEDQEIPWREEELYWTRNPVTVTLKKGWNTISAKIPGTSNYQNWMFSFIPLDTKGLLFSSSPSVHSTYYHQRLNHFKKLPNEKNEILFIGDSIIDGCEWGEMLGNKNIKNRGISGDITLGILDRLDEITESQPDKIFVMIGVNDLARGSSPKSVIKNIKHILAAIISSSPDTRIYLQSILPVNDYYDMFKAHTHKNDAIRKVNLALKKMEGNKVIFIDLHKSFLDKSGKLDVSYSNDGLHLNGKAYELWATLIKKYLPHE